MSHSYAKLKTWHFSGSVTIKNYGNANRSHQQRYCYDSINFDSSWELAFYIYHKSLNHSIKHEPIELRYVYNDVEHSYYPDFEVDGKLYEIKGDQFFKDDGTMQNPFDHKTDALFEAKHQCGLQNGVIFLRNNEIQPYLKYVYDTFGNGFLEKFKVNISKNKN